MYIKYRDKTREPPGYHKIITKPCHKNKKQGHQLKLEHAYISN